MAYTLRMGGVGIESAILKVFSGGCTVFVPVFVRYPGPARLQDIASAPVTRYVASTTNDDQGRRHAAYRDQPRKRFEQIPALSPEKIRQGMKLLRTWVPDPHAPGFRDEVRRQAALLRKRPEEIEALEFIEADLTLYGNAV